MTDRTTQLPDGIREQHVRDAEKQFSEENSEVYSIMSDQQKLVLRLGIRQGIYEIETSYYLE